MIYISEGLLYICFAMLMGTFLLRFVPEQIRPQVHVGNGLLLACAIAVPVLSFMPVHRTALLFASDFGISYGATLKSILTEINAGKAWLWTLIGSAGLVALLALKPFREDRHMAKVGVFITALLAIGRGYNSHAASLYSMKGLAVQSAHFLAVTVWIGTLFVVGWFSRSDENWSRFLGWFSPVAIVSVLVTLLSGLALMSFTTPEYVNAWMLPYGQLLLIKHLLIAPLLLFAYTNGFGYRSTIRRNPSFMPRPWLRAESVIALILFIVTGFLGWQTPPHNVRETLQSVPPSPLFTGLYRGSFSPDMKLTFTLSLESILMLAAALILAAGMIWMYRSNRLILAFAIGLLIPVFGYFGLMFALA
ncbi:copper resistance D family protein [Paenibacillus caui]|uniref:copper resistance D family protein n=1 Tax=Paenibacillus caui TaxID=2873927 RepID=UPI001CA898E6|nr:CopD family protein [Paenibacillus caui]